jgi:hypothetical protein
MFPFFLKAKTISDAWFQLIYNIFDNSYTQEIQRGSFEKEQYRLQYPGHCTGDTPCPGASGAYNNGIH